MPGKLKDQTNEVVLLWYRWPRKSENGFEYHWECDYCGTRMFSDHILKHVIVDHNATTIQVVEAE